jgi:hypothetical protein
MEHTEIITGYRKAISNPLLQFRTLIDTDKKVYMIRQTILGLFNTGSFLPLPKLDYVLIAKSFFQPACEACIVNDDEKAFYMVSLVHHKNRRIITHETKDREEALQLAEQLRISLNLSLKDVSETGKAKWTHLQTREPAFG